MSFLAQLRSLRAAPSSVWLQFTTAYQANTFDLYLFFEGRDDLAFYQPFLRERWASRGRLHSYNCNGKSNVLRIMQRVKRTLDHEWRGLFFIDKDVDDYCSLPRITDRYLYETEYYSIENFIVAPTTLTILWTDLLALPMLDVRLTQILAAFNRAYQVFVDAMRSVMAWIIHLRRCGHSVVLANVNMDRIARLDDDCVCTLKQGWGEHILDASSIKGIAHDSVLYKSIATELSERDPKTFIRGKFELWFFVKFIARIMDSLSARNDETPRIRLHAQISQTTAIAVLGARIAAPATLIAFLNSILPA